MVTTAGAQNHTYVKNLGATDAFDHKEPNVIHDILQVLKPGDVVYDCIGDANTQKACAKIVSELCGGKLPCVQWSMPSEYDNVDISLGMFQPSNIVFSLLTI